MKATVKKGTIEVADALAALGLTEEIVIEVVMAGEYARNSCTKNDPPCAPGFVAWKDTVRTFRDVLIPLGWTANDDNGFSTIVNRDETIAIAVATGDDKTGKADANPKTKYPRGAAAEAAINRNKDSLFAEMREDAEKASKKKTWILLKHLKKDTVFVELSLPASMTKDEQVEDWLYRIIIDPIKTDPNVEVQDDSGEEPLDVPVRRRS